MTFSHDQLFFSSAVRSIPAKSRGNRGYFPTNKVNDGYVEYESQIERDLYILLDHAPEVVKFQHQPVTIPYKDEKGKERNYTPDAYIKLRSGTEVLVEVKDYHTLSNQSTKYIQRWQACQLWCKKRGIGFLIVSEKEIRKSRLDNVWYCLGSSRVHTNDKYTRNLQNIIPDDGITYNLLCHQVSEEFAVNLNKASQIIAFSIYHGLVFVPNFSDKKLVKYSLIYNIDPDHDRIFQPILEELGFEEFELEKISEHSEELTQNYNNDLLFNRTDSGTYRLKIVKEFMDTPSVKRNHEWRTQFSDKYNLNISTVYAWVKKYKENGREALIDKYHRSGNKMSWNKSTIDLLEAGRKLTLKNSFSIKKGYHDYIVEMWDKDDEPPSYHTFYRYFKDKTSFLEEQIAKFSKKAEKDLAPSLSSFHGAIMPMQVLQIDNTPFDLFVNDDSEAKSIGTPNLCAVIDVYTRKITGYELTLSPINRQSVLTALLRSILPKKEFIQTIFNDTEYSPEWIIEGLPVLLLVDNGMDFRSNDVRRFCLQYGIILEFVPLATPRYKAYIEGWFNTLRNEIKHELDGKGYRASLIRRIQNTELRPEDDSVFNLYQTEKWLISWILDEYHHTSPYNDGLPSPLTRFRHYRKGEGAIILPEPQIVDPDDQMDLLMDTMMMTERTLNNNIKFQNLKYSSDDLIVWFTKFGKIKVKILYDSRDIRSIWVIHPFDNSLNQLSLSTGWANAFLEAYDDKPVSVSFWSKEMKRIREKNRRNLTLSRFKNKTGREYRKNLREMASKTKRKRRQEEILKENERKLAVMKKSRGNEIELPNETKNNSNNETKPRFNKREIDWSEVEKLPTDTMYKGR